MSNKKMSPLVFLSNYTVEQRTNGEGHENAISKVTIEFNVVAEDTHLTKHEDFLNDIRDLLEQRNKKALQA